MRWRTSCSHCCIWGIGFCCACPYRKVAVNKSPKIHVLLPRIAPVEEFTNGERAGTNPRGRHSSLARKQQHASGGVGLVCLRRALLIKTRNRRFFGWLFQVFSK